MKPRQDKCATPAGAAVTGGTGFRAAAAPAERRRDTIDGPEKLCIACGDWWPADGEFFYPAKRSADGLFYCCKACYQEMRRGRAAAAAGARAHTIFDGARAIAGHPQFESARS